MPGPSVEDDRDQDVVARRGGSDLEPLERERTERRAHRTRQPRARPTPGRSTTPRGAGSSSSHAPGGTGRAASASRRVGEAHGRARTAPRSGRRASRCGAGGHRARRPRRSAPPSAISFRLVVVARAGGRRAVGTPPPRTRTSASTAASAAARSSRTGRSDTWAMAAGSAARSTAAASLASRAPSSRRSSSVRYAATAARRPRGRGTPSPPGCARAAARSPPRPPPRAAPRLAADRAAARARSRPPHAARSPGPVRRSSSRASPASSLARGQHAGIAGAPAEPTPGAVAPHAGIQPLSYDAGRGRREPPEPPAPDEQRRARQEHEQPRRQANPAAQTAARPRAPATQSSAEGQIQGARRRARRPRSVTTATVLTPAARPPLGGGERPSLPTRLASAARRRTRPRPGASASRRRTIARWTPRPRPWTMRTSPSPARRASSRYSRHAPSGSPPDGSCEDRARPSAEPRPPRARPRRRVRRSPPRAPSAGTASPLRLPAAHRRSSAEDALAHPAASDAEPARRSRPRRPGAALRRGGLAMGQPVDHDGDRQRPALEPHGHRCPRAAPPDARTATTRPGRRGRILHGPTIPSASPGPSQPRRSSRVGVHPADRLPDFLRRTRTYIADATGLQRALATDSWSRRPAWSSGSRDHFVRSREHRRRNREPECRRSLEVDDQLELGWLLDGQNGRPGAIQYLVHVGCQAPAHVPDAGAGAHEASRVGKLAEVVDRRHAISCGQSHDPLPLLEEHRIGEDEQGTGAFPAQRGDRPSKPWSSDLQEPSPLPPTLPRSSPRHQRGGIRTTLV